MIRKKKRIWLKRKRICNHWNNLNEYIEACTMHVKIKLFTASDSLLFIKILSLIVFVILEYLWGVLLSTGKIITCLFLNFRLVDHLLRFDLFSTIKQTIAFFPHPAMLWSEYLCRIFTWENNLRWACKIG